MYFSISKQHFDRTSWYQGGLVSVVLIVFVAILAVKKCFCRLISRAKLFYWEHWNCVWVWLFTVKTLLFREISTSQLAFYIIFTRPSVCIYIFFSRLSIRLRFLSKGLGESWISPFVTPYFVGIFDIMQSRNSHCLLTNCTRAREKARLFIPRWLQWWLTSFLRSMNA